MEGLHSVGRAFISSLLEGNLYSEIDLSKD